VYFDASNNLLNGTIPRELTTLPLLITIFLDKNKLSGKILTWVFSWKNLVIFNASNNLLDGPIPQEIAVLSQLTSLSLANNQLSGKTPTGSSRH